MQARSNVLFLVEAAIFAALAFVLDFLSFSVWAQGGSISFGMVPIFLMAFRWGLKGGLVTGLLDGLLQLFVGNSYVVHPVQAILDYPLAFTVAGLAGIFAHMAKRAASEDRKGKLITAITAGVLLGSAARFASHFIGGMVFFGAAAGEGQPVWLYSLLYNGSYLLPSFIASLIVILLLVLSQKRFLRV